MANFNKLLKSFDIENDINVAIKEINFPDIPQWEMWDFFKFLISLPTSNGLVIIVANDGMLSNLSRLGAGSL